MKALNKKLAIEMLFLKNMILVPGICIVEKIRDGYVVMYNALKLVVQGINNTTNPNVLFNYVRKEPGIFLALAAL